MDGTILPADQCVVWRENLVTFQSVQESDRDTRTPQAVPLSKGEQGVRLHLNVTNAEL